MPLQNALLAQAGSAAALLISKGWEGVDKAGWEDFLRRVEKMEKEDLSGRLASEGVRLVLREDAAYPRALSLAHEAPHLLYVKGRMPLEFPVLSVVGTRRPSIYGRSQAIRFASTLGAGGFAVVSGLARGIDSAAISAAADAGAAVAGVLGTGIFTVYPEENAALFKKTAECGAVVSEFPPDAGPRKEHFPWRNRLIGAWGMGLLVVEAGLRSGSLITARWALELGKDIFALPGQVDREHARGCHKLIKDGAVLVEDPMDILDYYAALLKGEPARGARKAERSPGAAEGKNTAPSLPTESADEAGEESNDAENDAAAPESPFSGLGLSKEPLSLEELAEKSSLEPIRLTAELMKAVAAGRAKRLSGGRFVKV